MNKNPSEEASIDIAKKITEWIRVNGPRIPGTIRWVQIATRIFWWGPVFRALTYRQHAGGIFIVVDHHKPQRV
jgi:hypothetical protein